MSYLKKSSMRDISLASLEYTTEKQFFDMSREFVQVTIPDNTPFQLYQEFDPVEVSLGKYKDQFYLISNTVRDQVDNDQLVNVAWAKLYYGMTHDGIRFLLPVSQPLQNES